ncbi:hypothetical protein B0T26DRAFT_694643 [Lasiosphaeria miniovina]|uniref:Secreted protein n=1 Tax=Lasiosphaeria miniovina TaxID=1954250 RepID=A0AA40B4E7_9PEZI|nr:uncharacterized protein B0T26DRAFT_694643 [Lasiosphaeria miniovina]KAK0727452.1 hypothetical protein B0T26DRAFT_694643 [Lasiosphaeria miniovina]
MLRNFVLGWILPWFLSSTRRRGMVFRFLSGFGIRYRCSPVVGTVAGFKGPIRGGDGLPDGIVLEKSGADLKKTHLKLLCGGTPHHTTFFCSPACLFTVRLHGAGLCSRSSGWLRRAHWPFIKVGQSFGVLGTDIFLFCLPSDISCLPMHWVSL